MAIRDLFICILDAECRFHTVTNLIQREKSVLSVLKVRIYRDETSIALVCLHALDAALRVVQKVKV